MKRAYTTASFESYRDMMKGREVIGSSQSEFYSWLSISMSEVDNESLGIFIINIDAFVMLNLYSKKKFVGSQVIILQEYIKRVELFEEYQRIKQEEANRIKEALLRDIEKQAKINLAKWREEQHKRNAETLLQGKPMPPTLPLDDSTSVTQESQYSDYTLHRYQEEIAYHNQQRQDAVYSNDFDKSWIHEIKIKELTQRLNKLKSKIHATPLYFCDSYPVNYPIQGHTSTYFIMDDLVSGQAVGSRTATSANSKAGDITLKSIQDAIQQMNDIMNKKKGIKP